MPPRRRWRRLAVGRAAPQSPRLPPRSHAPSHAKRAAASLTGAPRLLSCGQGVKREAGARLQAMPQRHAPGPQSLRCPRNGQRKPNPDSQRAPRARQPLRFLPLSFSGLAREGRGLAASQARLRQKPRAACGGPQARIPACPQAFPSAAAGVRLAGQGPCTCHAARRAPFAAPPSRMTFALPGPDRAFAPAYAAFWQPTPLAGEAGGQEISACSTLYPRPLRRSPPVASSTVIPAAISIAVRAGFSTLSRPSRWPAPRMRPRPPGPKPGK